MDTTARLPGERLERVLRNLEIRVSSSVDGRYTVSTEQEPLFCFVRDTESEILAVVADTLNSYIETFYNVSEVEVTVVREGVAPLPRPEVLTPVSRLIPSIANSLNLRGREPVCA